MVVLPPGPVCADDAMFVNLVVNTEDRGDVMVTRTDDGDFLFPADDWAKLGLTAKAEGSVVRDGKRYLSLKAVLGGAFSFDEKTLRLTFTAVPADRGRTVVDLRPSRSSSAYRPRESSAFLNYGLTYSSVDPLGYQSLSLANKAGVRSGDWLFLTDTLYTKTRPLANAESQANFVRLMSSVTYEQRDAMTWYVLGDMTASSGELGSTVTLGGIGLFKVYRINPYFIKYPLLSMSGNVTFPSQAEIYVDNVLMGREKIAPGEFSINNLYLYGGSHSVELLLRDPFGQVERISYPTYFSDDLLKAGLHEYTYSIGFLREQYGFESNEYGKAAFIASHRYGYNNRVNIGYHAEASNGIKNLGPAFSVAIPRAGLLTAVLSESFSGGRTGTAAAVSHLFDLSFFSSNIQLRSYSRDYLTIGSQVPAQTKTDASISLSYTIPALGAFSIGHAVSERYAGGTVRSNLAGYSRLILPGLMFSVNGRVSYGELSDYAVYAFLNYTPQTDPKVSVQYQKTKATDAETVQIYNVMPEGEGVGYRATVSRQNDGTDRGTVVNPFVQYNARYGSYSVNASFRDYDTGSSRQIDVAAAGSLTLVGGLWGFSRPVNDSFGYLVAPGAAGRTVKLNDITSGEVRPDGLLIIPNMRSYYDNTVTVDTADLPVDYAVEQAASRVAPPQWSGACLTAEIARMQAVTGSVFIRKGDQELPIEFRKMVMKAGDREIATVTGKGGEFYVESLLPGQPGGDSQNTRSCAAIAAKKQSDHVLPGAYRAVVTLDGEQCAVEIVFPETSDVLTDLGHLPCGPIKADH